MTNYTPPPGWYQDPVQVGGQRFWDGQNWTANARMGVPPPPPPAPAPQPSGLRVFLVIMGIIIAVIVVIGILAGVAIPVFFSQRVKAATASVKVSVGNTSLAMESYYATHNHYPVTQAQLFSAGDPAISTGEHMTITTDGETGFCIAGFGTTGRYTQEAPKIYDTDRGGLQPDNTITCSNAATYTHRFDIP